MSKPPAYVDPEKFIIGKGVYGNLKTARAYIDERVFRLDPAPMPVVSMILTNLVIVAFFYGGFHWVIKHGAGVETDPWAVYGIPGIGLFTCIIYTTAVYYSFANAKRRGAWLIYELSTGRLTLPREGVSVERNEIVHLQYISTKRFDRDGMFGSEILTELNLVTCRNGERKRWPLLRSRTTFDRLLAPLARKTDLPIVRVKDEWNGWNVTEEPYGRRSSTM